MEYDVIVVGAGAAGLLAAIRAAERGRRTLLLEKNPHAGVKILMSGGTRCNLTHATDARGIVRAYGGQGKFLHSALAALSPADVVALIEAEGVPTKREETGKIFPVSDRAADIVAALLRRLERSGCTLALGEPVIGIVRSDDTFHVQTERRATSCAAVIVTTGGKSYPGCGTTGDGYPWATAFGHTLVPTFPALTPIVTNATWVLELRGITLPDVRLRVIDPAVEKPLIETRGSFLFTHFGLSGPSALDASREVARHARPASLLLECDLLPSLSADEFAAKLQAAVAASGKRLVATLLPQFVPQRLADAILLQSTIPPTRHGAELSKLERQQLVSLVKHCRIPVVGTKGYAKAEVTQGGVPLTEIDSRTMASRIVPGLYFAGEVLDLDGPIGGYNFQAAFSTGWLAGSHA